MTLEFPSRIETGKDVSLLSAFKTPAFSELFFEVRDASDLPALSQSVLAARGRGLPVAYLGDGTNCLFAFDRFPGLIVKNSLPASEVRDPGSARFEVSSSHKVHALSLAWLSVGSKCLLPWVGLPGNFGGAVVGNAGCFGLETADIFVSAQVWNVPESRMETLDLDDMEFAYRTSSLKGSVDRFVVSASFDLSRRKPANAFEEMDPDEFRQLRKTKQPAGRTCGSFFKNPPGHSAGALIDRAGLKGMKIG